jgi:hypothetical protein
MVIEKLGAITYHLDLPPTWKLHNAFHVSLLALYHETREHGANYLAPAPKLIEGEPEWEVERILASQHHRRHHWLQYLVQWVGYPESHNSWEPAENVPVAQLVEQFYKAYSTSVRGIKSDSSLGQEVNAWPEPLAALSRVLSPACQTSLVSAPFTIWPTPGRRASLSSPHSHSHPSIMKGSPLKVSKALSSTEVSMPMTPCMSSARESSP